MRETKITRIQADKMNEYLGMPLGTYIDEDILKVISTAPLGSTRTILGKPITMTPSIIALATLILKKI